MVMASTACRRKSLEKSLEDEQLREMGRRLGGRSSLPVPIHEEVSIHPPKQSLSIVLIVKTGHQQSVRNLVGAGGPASFAIPDRPQQLMQGEISDRGDSNASMVDCLTGGTKDTLQM